METKPKRIYYFDYLRIISIFAVVVLHVAAQSWRRTEINTFDWHMYNLGDGLVRWGVPVFVMISGALFLGREQTLQKLFKKNILRIAVIFVFWSVLYGLWDFFVTHKVKTVSQMFFSMMKGHYHLWFLLMIIGLYLIVPLLNKIAENHSLVVYFLILALIFALLIPQGIGLIGMKFQGLAKTLEAVLVKTNFHLALGYSGYFMLGYFLNKADINKKAAALIYILGFIGLFITIAGTAWLTNHDGKPNSSLYEYLTVNVCMTSMAVFVFAKQHMNKPIKNQTLHNCVMYFSKCSLGVYLVHIFVLEGLRQFFHFSTRSLAPIYSIPLLSLSVFFISLLISVILNKIPIINKWLM